ncbi:hypothetical protein BYT27DRAFT_7263643 [Phlegmacium glaucopus]|nr:hypothetical protein BYT27DRAFT_7263643 [Phlegmacium glaucopus]
MENLAVTYRNQGRWNEAEQLALQLSCQDKDMAWQLLGLHAFGTVWDEIQNM